MHLCREGRSEEPPLTAWPCPPLISVSSRMILAVLGGLLFGSDGYYVALAWTSCALMYFLVSAGPNTDTYSLCNL